MLPQHASDFSMLACVTLHHSVCMLLFSPSTDGDSGVEALEGQLEELGAGSKGTQEVVAEGGAMLQKGESVEEGNEEEEPEPSK